MDRNELVIATATKANDIFNSLEGAKKNPDYYQKQAKARLLQIISHLAEGKDLDEVENEWITTITEGVKRIVIEVHESDNVLDLLEKYADVKDAYNRIKKACENKGLHIEGSSIVK